MDTVNIADLAVVDIGGSNSFKDYLKQLYASVFNKTITITFDSLLIDKQTARKIYKRAYPKAKV